MAINLSKGQKISLEKSGGGKIIKYYNIEIFKC
jgi:hypothetical protein